MTRMSSQRTHSPLSDWLSLTRISNLPTIVSDSLVGVAMAFALQWIPDASSIEHAITTTIAMCAFYLAGMVLNGIVDKEVDARERPTRPIASGRIALPWAWTAFIVLMLLGTTLRPSWYATPGPVAAAALIGVWLLARARTMRSHTLDRLGKAWCVVAVIGAAWWAIDMMVRDPFDLSDLKENTQTAIRTGALALNLPVLVIAFSLVAYNVLHKRTAWAIAFLALCRACVPIAVAAAILVPAGFINRLYAMNSVSSPQLMVALVVVATFPTAIAIHTILLSIVARREMSSDGATTYRCAKCGYLLATSAPRVCAECGCDLLTTPPLGDRALASPTRWALPLLAGIALLPLLVIAVPKALRSDYGIAGVEPLGVLELAIVNYPLFLVFAVWFVIAATLALRAAISHPSRRPAGVAALIASIALLGACSASLLLSPIIALSCVALWFVTRWMQRRIAGS